MEITIILATLIIVGFLTGIRLMQTPRTALWGNRLGALSMLIAIIWTFLATGQGAYTGTLIYVLIGGLLGLILGQSIKMIHMPQTVALLNGFGGAASALVVWAAVLDFQGQSLAILFWATSGLALCVGALTFSGSIIAVLKLQGLAFRKPVILKGHDHILRVSILLAALLILINMILPGMNYFLLLSLVAMLGLLGGFFMTLRIGGADMPIVISLLNSFSGVAAAIAGLAVENIILIGTGAMVGVAGLILTRIMCQAMNRSLFSVLAGFTPANPNKESEAPEAKLEVAAVTRSSDSTSNKAKIQTEGDSSASEGPELDLSGAISQAEKVIIVPGYGMAVAQAQNAVKQLLDALEGKGKEVKFAIHPVAGRMPGHMNVLLAEAGIDYEKLMDLDAINPYFEHADLVIIVGACDVVNPAANQAESTPISGMPILDAEKAKHIIVCNIDDQPGYSGVDNLLYYQKNVFTWWGDAAETIPMLTEMTKQ